ncbi:MAG TPA: lysophospholipid acyltransferase family protein [Candidatus Ozemobacteraceae bacterium]|nr:lysophospholipid acyltransferase family protein [Candidatus Ozemobacteraceae bacterium]
MNPDQPTYSQRLQCHLLNLTATAAARMTTAGRRRAGMLLAGVVFDVLRIRRTFVTDSLRRHLGLDDTSSVETARHVYRSFFTNAVEMATLPFLSEEEVRNTFEAVGLDHLRTARDRGHGVIIISSHYGPWEFIPPWLCLNGFRMTTVVRRQRNPAVDAWFERMRHRFGAQTTDSGFGLREILRTLRRGDLLGLMSDQNAGDRGYFVDFLGEPASTVVGPAQIALKSRAPLVLVAAHPRRQPPHLLEILPPIDPDAYTDDEAGRIELTQAFTHVLEEWIRKRPDQWFWLHRRWKSRPAGKEGAAP